MSRVRLPVKWVNPSVAYGPVSLLGAAGGAGTAHIAGRVFFGAPRKVIIDG